MTYVGSFILKHFLFASIITAIRIPENAWETINGNKKRDVTANYAAKKQKSTEM